MSKVSFSRIVDLNDTLLNALGDAPDVPRVLVGSMRDLGEQRQVSTEVSMFDDVRLVDARAAAAIESELMS